MAGAFEDLATGQRALVLFVQFHEHEAHRVGGGAQGAAAATAAAQGGVGVGALDAGDGQDAIFHLAHQQVDFVRRKIAAGPHRDPGEGRVGVGEERHPAPELAVGPERTRQHQHGGQQRQAGVARRGRQQPRIPASGARQFARVAFFQLNQRPPGAFVAHARLAEQRPDGGAEQQRVEQRAGEHEKHRHRQVAHELAGHARPEDERQKGGERGGHGRGDRPEHAGGGAGIGAARVHPLGHLAIRVLGDDDGAVDEHAEAEQHAERHHEVEGVAQGPDEDQREQERHRDRHADDQAAAQADGRHHQHHHQHQGGGDVAFQLGHLGERERRLVLGVEQLHLGRQGRAVALHDFLHLRHGVHHVGARPLGDVDGDGVVAVHPRVVLAILEGAADGGDVRERHHRIAVGLDGQIEDVLGGLDDARHLHGHAPGAGVQRAGGDQAVVAQHGVQQLLAADLVGLELGGIDHYLEQLFAVALQLGLQHVRQRPHVVADFLGQVVDQAFRHLVCIGATNQVDLQNGEVVGALLQDVRFFRRGGKLRLGAIHRGAHVLQGLVEVVGGVELHHYPSHAFVGERAHFVDAFHGAHLDFHRLHQEPRGILRGDALVRHRHHEHRHFDVWVRFDGDEHAGCHAGQDHHGHQQQRGARAAHRGVDQDVVHDLSSSASAPARAGRSSTTAEGAASGVAS